MRPARRPVHDLPDVFRGRDAVAEGALTVDQLRGPLVERVVQGVYRPSWVPLSHALQCRAVALVMPEDAAVTGASCATFRGVDLARAGDPVEICVPSGTTVRPRRGVSVRWSRAPLGEVTVMDGVPLVEAHRMAFDLAAKQGLPRAVARLDAVARHGLLRRAGLQAWLVDRRENDVRHVRRAAELIDPRAESLPESEVRVLLAGAGLPLEPQHVVRLGAGVLARVDLAIVELKIAIEYDGAWHALRQQLASDRERLNGLTRAGWSVIHVTADLLAHPRRLIAVVEAAVRERTSAPS